MLDGDKFSRMIEHPRAFTNGRLDPETYFQFIPTNTAKSVYALSVASKFILKTIDAVHSYGAGVAQEKNNRFLELNGHEPDPAVTYVGHYDLFLGSINRINLDYYSQGVRWVPENGRTAHFQIELYPSGNATKSQLKADRRKARAALFDVCMGPALCPDAVSNPELSAIIDELEAKPDWCWLPA